MNPWGGNSIIFSPRVLSVILDICNHTDWRSSVHFISLLVWCYEGRMERDDHDRVGTLQLCCPFTDIQSLDLNGVTASQMLNSNYRLVIVFSLITADSDQTGPLNLCGCFPDQHVHCVVCSSFMSVRRCCSQCEHSSWVPLLKHLVFPVRRGKYS